MELQQVVVTSDTGTVLRAGFCDFKTDGTFDPATEVILKQDIDYLGRAIFDPPPPDATWVWDGDGFVRVP